MNPLLIPISQLDPPGLDALAALHLSTMQTLLSDLGPPVVRHYYEVCQVDPAVIGLCALSPLPLREGPGVRAGVGASAPTLGWAVGSPYPDEINTRVRRPLAWFAGQMLRLAITRPGILRQLAVSAILGSAPLERDAIELTYIGVGPEARGQGLGKALLSAFISAARSAGYRSVVLSVETDNPAAIALYTQSGFKITRTFTEGHFTRHRMQLVF